MKKIKIVAQINGDEVAFSIQKSKDTSSIDILGTLDVITAEVRQNLKNKVRITTLPNCSRI